jgi:hypothetical protein
VDAAALVLHARAPAPAEHALLCASTRLAAQRHARAAEARIVALLPVPLVAQSDSKDALEPRSLIAQGAGLVWDD